MPEPTAPLLITAGPDVVAAPSAVAELRQRWLRRARRTAVLLPGLCLGISTILSAVDGHSFLHNFVYSMLIASSCMLIVDGMRFALAWLSDRVRNARGLPYVDTPAAAGWRGVIPGALASMVLGPSIGLSIGDWLFGTHTPSMLNLDHPSTRITLAFSIVATVLSVVGMSTAERLAQARAQAQAAQRMAVENQLRLLQSQLEPHMLFNTLANLRVLIGLDPAQAQAMLDRLISFLRNTLNASRQDTHALSAEFAHLDDYLSLMAVRMGSRLSVAFDLPAELSTLQVPPLLLQPLVENAIKHGLEPQVSGGRILVTARGDGKKLTLTVRDTGGGLDTSAQASGRIGASFGLEQVRTRLSTLYGPRGTLTLQPAPDEAGGALATVQLPWPPTQTTQTR